MRSSRYCSRVELPQDSQDPVRNPNICGLNFLDTLSWLIAIKVASVDMIQLLLDKFQILIMSRSVIYYDMASRARGRCLPDTTLVAACCAMGKLHVERARELLD